VQLEIIQTQSRRPNNIQKTSMESYKTQIKILAYPGLSLLSFEQPNPGAPLLDFAKSIYYYLKSCTRLDGINANLHQP